MSIDAYVTTLCARLTIPRTQAAELSDEVRGHLEDAARDLQMAGLGPRESELEAIRRFGPPDDIATAVLQTRRTERRQAARRGTRMAGAVLAAAIVLAALSGNVASAYTSGSHMQSHTVVSGVHGQTSVPSTAKGYGR